MSGVPNMAIGAAESWIAIDLLQSFSVKYSVMMDMADGK
jgi:hypothetical protein